MSECTCTAAYFRTHYTGFALLWPPNLTSVPYGRWRSKLTKALKRARNHREYLSLERHPGRPLWGVREGLVKSPTRLPSLVPSRLWNSGVSGVTLSNSGPSDISFPVPLQLTWPSTGIASAASMSLMIIPTIRAPGSCGIWLHKAIRFPGIGLTTAPSASCLSNLPPTEATFGLVVLNRWYHLMRITVFFACHQFSRLRHLNLTFSEEQFLLGVSSARASRLSPLYRSRPAMPHPLRPLPSYLPSLPPTSGNLHPRTCCNTSLRWVLFPSPASSLEDP